jgi:signal transduction histidine kinase
MLLVLVCAALQAHAWTLELRDACAAVTVQDCSTLEQVQLPYHWDRHHPSQSGEASFDLKFHLGDLPTVPHGLYMPRLGNVFEIWLNGVLLQRKGDLQHADGPDFAKVPRFLVISPGLLRTANLLRVSIHADIGRRGGLAALTLGPEEEVHPIYLSAFLWRSTGSLAVVVLSLLIAFVAIALWVTQVDPSVPGRIDLGDPLYLFAGLAQLCWSISVSDAIIESPPIPWPWWGMVAVMASTAWVCSMTLFCVEVANWSRLPPVKWLRRWLAFLLAASALSGAGALDAGHPMLLTALYAASGVTATAFVLLFVPQAVYSTSHAHKMVTLALMLNTAVGIRDLYVFRVSQVYGENTLLRYSSVLFGLALAYIVIMRFRTASRQVRALMANMASQVAQKEQALHASYQRVEQLAREQERVSERTRVLRDMHDGVGSHISTAIRQLQSGKASRDEVLHTLRDSLDQLKLSIDAMHLPPGDINALLANIRYRLEPRFLACGISLQWDVDLLEPITRVDANAMRQLQFMLFEALSNVLQHAGSSSLSMAAHPVGPHGLGARLQIIDNGRGYDVAQPRRNGLLSMQQRATALGMLLRLDSAPGRTVVEITIE